MRFELHKLRYFFFVLISVLCQAQKENLNTSIIDIIVADTTDTNAIKIKKLKDLLPNQKKVSASENIGYLYHKLGLIYFEIEDYEKAITATKKAVQNREQIKEIDTKKLNKSLLNISLYYSYLNNFDKSKSYLEKIINNKAINKYTFKAYLDLGELYAENGDYYSSLETYKAAEVFSKKNSNYDILLKSHLGSIYVYSELDNPRKDFDKIIFHKNEIEKWQNKSPKTDIASMYNNLGNIYESLGNKTKSLQLYSEAITYYKKENLITELSKVFTNIAIIYAKDSKIKIANSYFEKAINKTDNLEVKSLIFNNQGYYLQTDNPIDKLVYYQKALQCLFDDKNNKNLDYLPSLAILKKSSYRLTALYYLMDMTEVWVAAYEKNRNKEYLLKAEQNIKLIDQLVSYIRFESDAEKSKLFWINKGVNIYMLGVTVCYFLDDIEKAFYYMEKNKSLLLLENLNELEENNTDSSSFKMKQPEIISLQKCIDKHVSNTSNFVEYILNDKHGFGIFCSATKNYFFEIPEINVLLTDVKKIKKMCSKSFETKEDFKTYANISNTVLKKIFPFKNALNTILNKKLIIVPDYQLQNFPFEALSIKSKTENFKENYLIQNVEISYLQSASVYEKINQRQRKTKKELLGVAIGTFKSEALTPLPNSIRDMEQISRFYPSTLLLQRKATKSSFLTKIQDYKILHLNTHAGLDTINKEPWISFWDEKLYLKELYGKTNQADLVLLDACKSASGTLEIGEGIMSLSRGFFHNGAKSVIATQWNANEKSNAKILYQFYKNLKAGKSKSQALYQAKLNYLKNHQLSETSPYFWASLILTGDSGKIEIDNTSNLWIYTAAFLILILIIILKKTFF